MKYKEFRATITREELVKLYKTMSLYMIADFYNTTYHNIRKAFIELKIPFRNKREATQLAMKLHPDIQEKSKVTKISNGTYGKNNPEATMKTNLLRYGNRVGANSESGKEKAKQTRYENYGELVDNSYQLTSVIEKIDKIKRERYGPKFEKIVDKYQNTMMDEYGEYCTAHMGICHAPKYKYDNETFDSLPELALWVYALDHNEEIERTPVKLLYEFEGVQHYYFPDFKYNGKLVEIKGEHFFKQDGTMCNPYDHSLDGLYEAKHQCGLNNDVKFIIDASKFINYFNSKYNKEDFKLGVI